MPWWEELASARRALLDSYRVRVQAWSGEAIPALVRRFQEAAGTALEAMLEAMLAQPPWDLDTFEEQLRARACRALADCQAEAMRALQAEAEGLVRNLGREAGSALADQWAQSQAAGTGQEDLRHSVAAALRAGGMRWEPPFISQPSPMAGALNLPPRFLGLFLPGRWARHRIITRIRPELPAAIRNTSESFAPIARDYMDRCLTSLDGALDLQVQQIRANLERGVHPEGLGAPLAEGAGCAVCAQVWSAMYAFFRQFQHALVADAEVQGAFRAADGLCPSHLWFLERFSSPRGLCAGLPGLLADVARRLATLAQGGPRVAVHGPVPVLAHPDRCVACQTLEQATRDAVERIRGNLRETVEVHSPDLCLQHLPLVLAHLEPGPAAELAHHLALRLVQVAEAMAGFSLKSDACRRDLLTEAERRAYREALAWLAGDRNLLGHPGGES